MEKLTAASPEAQSADLVAANIEQLKALFPELITEGADGVAVNVDVLKALVGDASVTDADEKYGLNWHGKRRARQLALTPSTGTLRPCPEDSVDWETTQNLMIEGDNLEVLKLLQKSYAGKVKLIYIDPPYNTGKDFVYPDNFQDNIKNYLELTGQVEGGQRISSNTEASGRFHTDWLNMMYPRLKLAKNLLLDSGLIIISIDSSEATNLRLIMDEVFGQENFIGLLPTIMNLKGNNDAFAFADTHEFTVVY
ncbi:site-specific DNA-methyltransferase, partial [Pseudomonas aeruginosa]|nr:site-specific DNA-methyltransferase [Pseudomonas aeruginosa]